MRTPGLRYSAQARPKSSSCWGLKPETRHLRLERPIHGFYFTFGKLSRKFCKPNALIVSGSGRERWRGGRTDVLPGGWPGKGVEGIGGRIKEKICDFYRNASLTLLDLSLRAPDPPVAGSVRKKHVVS